MYCNIFITTLCLILNLHTSGRGTDVLLSRRDAQTMGDVAQERARASIGRHDLGGLLLAQNMVDTLCRTLHVGGAGASRAELEVTRVGQRTVYWVGDGELDSSAWHKPEKNWIGRRSLHVVGAIGALQMVGEST